MKWVRHRCQLAPPKTAAMAPQNPYLTTARSRGLKLLFQGFCTPLSQPGESSDPASTGRSRMTVSFGGPLLLMRVVAKLTSLKPVAPISFRRCCSDSSSAEMLLTTY